MTVGERIRALRTRLEMSQVAFADALNVSKQTLYKYENNIITNIPSDKIEAAAKIGNISPACLMGWVECSEEMEKELLSPKASNIVPFPEMEKVPLVGKIACGTPILAEENIRDFVSAPKQMRASFSLICQGDSMVDAGIYDGDIVYIRSQPEVENGEIAAVLIGDEATLKQVYITSDTLLLVPANQSYKPTELKREEMNSARILGKYVGLTRFVEK